MSQIYYEKKLTMKQNNIKAKKWVPICPVGCKYCMAQKIDMRVKYWKDTNRIWVNKSCVFFNRLPQDPKIQDMNFPWHLLDWEYLWYQGITDCFRNIFTDDLKYIAKRVAKSSIRKLCLISKIPINSEQISILTEIKDKTIICYSTTWLDDLEQTTTMSRIESLVTLRDLWFDVLPVMHPYIHWYTKAEEVFRQLKKYGFDKINWKGFRYNKENMKWLNESIPNNVLNQYNSDEEENLLGINYLAELAKKYNLQYYDLKEYLHKNPIDLLLDEKKVLNQVDELLKMCVFSSSSSQNSVKENCISRRLWI